MQITSKQNKILIVDDTATNLDVLYSRLSRSGFKVLIAQDGESAIRQAIHAQPDLILLDVMMPGLSGFETCDILKKNESTKEIPIIFMTALSDVDSKVSGFEKGAVDFVTKPVEYEEVLARVNTHLIICNLQKELRDKNEKLEQEITEREQAEAALRESEQRYALSALGSNDGLWDWDLSSWQIFFSARWKAMLGYEEHEINHHLNEWFSRVHPDDFEHLKAEIEKHVEGKTPHLEAEYRVLHQKGNYLWMLCRGLAVRHEDGQAYRMAGSQTDITIRKAAEARLWYDAKHDALTGLPNRAMIIEQLEQAIQRSKQTHSYLFAILFLDLDRFKLINDSWGHLVGDQLLIAVAERLQKCIRPMDMVARLGGDEFTILLDGIRDIQDPIHVSNRILESLVQPIILNKQKVFTTASIGIAFNNGQYDKAEDLLRDADIAMYKAKENGRGQYKLFNEGQHGGVAAQLRMESELRQAVKENGFAVHYQPIVSLPNRKTTSFEALIYWQHSEHGLIPPSEFMSLAEEMGLIMPVGQWVLLTACTQLRALHVAGFPSLKMAVNVSATEVQQENLSFLVAEVLRKTEIPAASLQLEISERTALETVNLSMDALDRLGDMGVQIAIDDFGTGYSSLTHLKNLPAHILKIDQSFISNIGKNKKDEAIIVSIIELSHRLGLTVVAEGIEREEQLSFLQSYQCDEVQGFLTGKAMAAETLADFLRM